MADDLIHDKDAGIERLLEIMRRLRDPETGCPWDIDQDFDSIAPYTIEEAYEVADAIERRDWAQQTADWEAIKARERAGKAQGGALDGVAVGLPALLRAYKLQKRAARVGFDWPDASDVIAKITEEASELVEARDTLTQVEVAEEFGDLMFVMANLGRHLGLEPEAALRAANAKFTRRFEGVETKLKALGKTPVDSDLAEMDALWDAVKADERAGSPQPALPNGSKTPPEA